MSMILFSQTYDGESIYDLGRDVMEAFDPAFNAKAKDVPVDKYNIQRGSFIVTIQYVPEESNPSDQRAGASPAQVQRVVGREGQ